MASSASGQDESNPALWLATQAGKMELSCPHGTTHRVPQEKFPRKAYNKSFIDQACLVNNPYISINGFHQLGMPGIPKMSEDLKLKSIQNPPILQQWSKSL